MLYRTLAVLMASFVALTTLGADFTHGKTLRWGNDGDVTSMDPYAFYTTVNASFLGNIYEPLVRYDKNLNFEPALATSWERVTPTVWRFTLRRDVKFHNGNPFTADDVVASLLRASHPNSPYYPASSQVQDVQKVDDYTVDIVLKDSYALILNDLAGVYIMNKKWMEENNTLQPVNPSKGEESYATSNANGTGPFMLKTRRPDTETVLVVNPNWWDKREHNIEKVIYRPIRSDATRIAALLSGELDLVVPVPLQDIQRIERDPSAEIMIGQNLRVILIGLNQGAEELKGSNVKGRNPLSDVRIRQALHQAIDTNTLSERIMRGLSKPTASVVANQIKGYTPVLDEVTDPYDPDQARKLLAEAGYPEGFEIGFSCPNDNNINSEQICQALSAMWARIGIKVNLVSQPGSLHIRTMLDGDADLYLMGWANTPQLDAFSILNNVLRKGGRWNPGGYFNPEVENLIAQLEKELDAEKREKIMSEALLIQKKDFGLIPLHRDPLIWAKRKDLEITQMPDYKVRLWWARFK